MDSFAGEPLLDPKQLLQTCIDGSLPTDSWLGKANVFRCPGGADVGTGAVLLSKRSLDRIDRAKDHTLRFDDGVNRVDLKKITPTAADCLSPGWPNDPDAAYLVTLADRRWHLRRRPCGRAYNLRSAADGSFRTATLRDGRPWAWAELHADLWAACGIDPAPPLPFSPHGTPGGFDYSAHSAWDAVSDLLRRLACAARFDPTKDGPYTVVRLGDPDPDADKTLRRLREAGRVTWDGYPVELPRADRPAAVRVLFRKLPPGDGSPWAAETVELPAHPQAVPGSAVILYDDLEALSDNAGERQARAKERASDWLRKHDGFDSRFLRQYAGVDASALAVGGSLYAGAAVLDRGPGLVTEAWAGPDGGLEGWRPCELDCCPADYPYGYGGRAGGGPGLPRTSIKSWKPECQNGNLVVVEYTWTFGGNAPLVVS